MEKHGCERETRIGCLSYALQPGTEPAAQAGALTGSRTDDLSFCFVGSYPTTPVRAWSFLNISGICLGMQCNYLGSV